MRMKDSVWQGSFGYWQTLFIHQNVLVIGYAAWSGHLKAGRGMVACEIIAPIPPSLDWGVETLPFNRAFIPQSQVAMYLQALELEAGVEEALLRTIATYDPSQEIVLLIMGNGDIDINYLQHLTILPAQCYEQMLQRWSEFPPSFV